MDLTGALWRRSSHSDAGRGRRGKVPAWRKSSRSGPNGAECLEVAPLPGMVAIRDSKDPDGPALTIDHGVWLAFTARIKSA